MTVTAAWSDRYRDPRQRAWLRVSAYAEHHANTHGHAPLTTGELGRALNLDQQQVSRAVDLARREGWLHPSSSARCLVLPRADPIAPCPALHRDGA